jgi:hypothetical protein
VDGYRLRPYYRVDGLSVDAAHDDQVRPQVLPHDQHRFLGVRGGFHHGLVPVFGELAPPLDQE